MVCVSSDDLIPFLLVFENLMVNLCKCFDFILILLSDDVGKVSFFSGGREPSPFHVLSVIIIIILLLLS